MRFSKKLIELNIRKAFCFLVLFASISTNIFAQEKFTFSGYLKDASTGEELLYANVFIGDGTIGTTTNLYGFYSLTLEAGEYDVTYSYLGYETGNLKINLQEDLEHTIELSPDSKVLEEIVVTAESKDKNVSRNEMGVVGLQIAEAKKIPVIFGEQDILKTIQLMPGVKGSGEGGSGFFVRGGNSDQNLILLDEAPVYNASHLLGFFSVFNTDALKDVKLYKGGMPAQYGGRASSVLDIRMKNGNSKKWTTSGGIGLISSRLTVEGPLKKDKGSVIISGRRTYADALYKLFSNKIDGNDLYFYDLNLKANYTITPKDRIYYSAYLGRDVLGFQDVGFDWGNTTNSLRWNHTFNQKLFLNTTFITSDFDYGFRFKQADEKLALDAGIKDFNIKQDYNYYLNPSNTISFGINFINHKLDPGKLKEVGAKNDDFTIENAKSYESGIYLSNDQKITKKFSVYYGLRFSMLNNVGAKNVNQYDSDGDIVGVKTYKKGDIYKTYYGFEPRFNATYLLSKRSSVKASYNRNFQYLHRLSNFTSGSPTDLWISSSPNIKPTEANQVALGYFQNFKDNQFEFSLETYYKTLSNQVDYKEGANTLFNPEVEADLLAGQGRAYGAEFMVRKNEGRATGWVSYTLARSQRKIDGINQGEWYSAKQDRIHDVSVVANYELSKKWSVGATWVYNTGDAVSFPTGKYNIDGVNVNLYSGRNGYRMPAYHRADIGFTWVLKDNAKRHSDLNFSFYNVYHRKNAYSITFRDSETIDGGSEAVKTSLFGIVPSVTWNFKF